MKPCATFDFINNTIQPEEAISKQSEKLLNDYISWLPTHCHKHNCDFDQLEKLTIVISADFENGFYPPRLNKTKQVRIQTNTFWKAANKDEEMIEISLNEFIDDYHLKTGIPEM